MPSTYHDRIATRQFTSREYVALLASPLLDDELSGPDPLRLVVIDAAESAGLPSPGCLPFVVAGLGAQSSADGHESLDLVVAADDLERVSETVARCPVAAVSLALLLRSHGDHPGALGLAHESATYSMLQAGGEFAAWRAERAGALPDEHGPVVAIERDGSNVTITLDRPERHNAITARLRDELCAALAVPLTDRSVTMVRLRGNGPSFSSGGDLAEFGSRPDPAGAHLTRLTRSPARMLLELRERATVELVAEVHGHALGGGIEMAAFANRVVADPGTTIGLPELELGLVPGAGGTVSVTRRIGRQRTAWLALTGRRIDAATAHRWGLVDELRTTGPTAAGDRQPTRTNGARRR